MKNTIDLTEKRIFRKEPPQSILGDRQNVTIKIEKGRKKFPWKEYESTDALISDNCNKLAKLNIAITNSMYLSSNSLDRTTFSFRLGENDERVWYTYSNSPTSSSDITPLIGWYVDDLETIPLNFNRNRTSSNDLLVIHDAYVLDRLPHPLNKKRIKMKLAEINRSQKWRKIWRSPKEKFEKRRRELPWNSHASFNIWKWVRSPDFKSSMPPYHYATILDAMEEAVEMDENGWRPLRSRNPVPWNNYGKGKKNPLNTFNLPEEYYDNYDDAEMPTDQFFLNTNDTNMIIDGRSMII